MVTKRIFLSKQKSRPLKLELGTNGLKGRVASCKTRGLFYRFTRHFNFDGSTLLIILSLSKNTHSWFHREPINILFPNRTFPRQFHYGDKRTSRNLVRGSHLSPPTRNRT